MEKSQMNKEVKAFLEKVCRFCHQEYDEKVPLPSYNNLVEDVECVKVERGTKLPLILPNNENMPKNMCSLCAAKIEKFSGFLGLAYDSEARLRNQLGLNPKNPSLEAKRKEEGKVLFTSAAFKLSNMEITNSPDENSVKSEEKEQNVGVPIFCIPMKSLNVISPSSDEESMNSVDEKKEVDASLEEGASVLSMPMMALKLVDLQDSNSIKSDKGATESEFSELMEQENRKFTNEISTTSDDEKDEDEASASPSSLMKSLN